MTLRSLEPKSSASASSATFARDSVIIAPLGLEAPFYRAKTAAARTRSAGTGDETRGVRRPQAHTVSSIAKPVQSWVGSWVGTSTCRPSWASHSAARSSPRAPMICSKMGTRKARQSWSRSAAVSSISCGRAKAMIAWVSFGGLEARASNCARLAAMAAGANASASGVQPSKARTGDRSRNTGSRNHGTRTAVRGASPRGYRNAALRDFQNCSGTR